MTTFDSINGSQNERQVYMYRNRKIIVCGLPDVDRQRYIDKFKSLGIDKCPYEIMRTEQTDQSLASQNGVNNMTIKSY